MCFQVRGSYPNKLVMTGEGGMVQTADPQLAERCHSLGNLYFQPERHFVHEELGVLDELRIPEGGGSDAA